MGKIKIIGFILYLFFGIYLINLSFGFISLPKFISGFENWIILISGILVILGGINYLRG